MNSTLESNVDNNNNNNNNSNRNNIILCSRKRKSGWKRMWKYTTHFYIQADVCMLEMKEGRSMSPNDDNARKRKWWMKTGLVEQASITMIIWLCEKERKKWGFYFYENLSLLHIHCVLDLFSEPTEMVCNLFVNLVFSSLFYSLFSSNEYFSPLNWIKHMDWTFQLV